MLFRVSGKLSGDRTFASRVEADSAIAAVVSVNGSLKESGIEASEITELTSRPMKGKSSVHIGKAKAPKAKTPETAAPAAPAAATPAQPKKR